MSPDSGDNCYENETRAEGTEPRGVFVVTNRNRDDRMRARIAVYTVGPNAVLAGASAAWWLGLIDRPPYPHVVIAARDRHGAKVRGARIWHRDLADDDVVVFRGLRTTARPLTVLDASVDIGVSVMDSALLRKQVTLGELIDTQKRNAGRRGSRCCHAMLSAMSGGARSEAERLVVDILTAASISGWTANHQVLGYLVDVAFPELRIAIEIDGFAFHSDAHAFRRDRKRQNDLVAEGWTVLRFTWHDVTEQPDDVLARILAALASAAA